MTANTRRYDDACGTAHGLDLVGDRWALLVLRELMLGPRRFSQLRADLPGITAKVLTQRLEELAHRGLLARSTLPPPASVAVYELTPWGYEAEPIVVALGRWAARSPWHDPTLPISAVSFMLSLRATFDPVRAAGVDASVAFEIAGDRYFCTVKNGHLSLGRGPAARPQVTFIGTAQPLAGLLHAMVPWGSVKRDKRVAVEGDLALARTMTALFPLPAKASVAKPKAT